MKESQPKLTIKELKFDPFELHLALSKRRSERDGSAFCEGKKVSVDALHEGDVLVVESLDSKASSSFLYNITGAGWQRLSIDEYPPNKIIFGTLDGATIDQDWNDQIFYLSGSGAGGATFELGSITPGALLYFVRHDTGKFEKLPLINDYGVARKNRKTNSVEVLRPSELATSNMSFEEKHKSVIAKVLSMLKKFGFDGFDFLNSKRNAFENAQIKDFKDDAFHVVCSYGMARGNRLSVFNRKTKQMIICKYFNYENQNMLQVAHADLSKSAKQDFASPDYLSVMGMHSANVPIVTFTSSPSLDLDVTSCHISSAELISDLSIPENLLEFAPKLDVQLWPDGSIRLGSGYFLEEAEKQRPGTKEKIKEKIKLRNSQGGHHILVLPKVEISIKSIEDILSEILG